MAPQGLIYATNVVDDSPIDDAETVIATLTGVTSRAGGQPVQCTAFANVTADATATDCIIRIRRGGLTGTALAPDLTLDGADIAGAANFEITVAALDSPGEMIGGVYVLTLEITGATGPSPVNGATLQAVLT